MTTNEIAIMTELILFAVASVCQIVRRVHN